jgi:hypothetical protein
LPATSAYVSIRQHSTSLPTLSRRSLLPAFSI